MSSLLEIEPDVRDEPITEPPKKWRNKYRALVSGFCRYRRWITIGQILPGTSVWPSKEVAEQVAMEEQAKCFSINGFHVSEYLGAFPVDDE